VGLAVDARISWKQEGNRRSVNAEASPITPEQAIDDKSQRDDPGLVNRQLAIGNTSASLTQDGLVDFLNAKMREVEMCGPAETPILSIGSLSQGVWVIELASSEMTGKACRFYGILVSSSHLKPDRPCTTLLDNIVITEGTIPSQTQHIISILVAVA
jgi:hypothetical protein